MLKKPGHLSTLASARERKAYFAAKRQAEKLARPASDHYRVLDLELANLRAEPAGSPRHFASDLDEAALRVDRRCKEDQKQRDQEQRRAKRIAKYNTQKRADQEAHRTKLRGIEEAKRATVRADRWPAIPVAIAQAPLTARMSPAAYALSIWLIARAQSTRKGTAVLPDGTRKFALQAFPSDFDFGFDDDYAAAARAIRWAIRKGSAQWSECLLVLPDGVTAPIVERATITKDDRLWIVEFKLHPAVEALLFDRDTETNERIWPRFRFKPVIVSSMTSFSSQRMFLEAASRNWQKRHADRVPIWRRRWSMSPAELRASLGLRPDERATTVERTLVRAIEDLPVSPVTRVQWSPKRVGKRVTRYEFQLVPKSSDIRVWFSHREPMAVAEDYRTLFVSTKIQVARYWRNLKRAHDKLAWFREYVGNSHSTAADKERFERLLPMMAHFMVCRIENAAAPEAVPLHQIIERYDRPRLPNERYVPGRQIRVEFEDDEPLLVWNKPVVWSPAARARVFDYGFMSSTVTLTDPEGQPIAIVAALKYKSDPYEEF